MLAESGLRQIWLVNQLVTGSLFILVFRGHHHQFSSKASNTKCEVVSITLIVPRIVVRLININRWFISKSGLGKTLAHSLTALCQGVIQRRWGAWWHSG